MYLGFWQLNALEALPLLGVTLKYASEVSKSGQIAQVDQVGPLAPLAPLDSVPQAQAAMELNTEPPVIPAHLVEILTPEAHRAWFQRGVYLCHEQLMVALM